MTWSLKAYPTTDLNDANSDKVRQVMLPFQDFGAKRMFAGRIKTAVTMEDAKLVQQELFKTPGGGAVVVLDGGGSFRSAMLGDLNADLLAVHGWAGIVINGVVRDARALAGSIWDQSLGRDSCAQRKTRHRSIGSARCLGECAL
ncbi:MAG: hypothetical protein AAFO97_18125 [Pseudomonadota bacterium]